MQTYPACKARAGGRGFQMLMNEMLRCGLQACAAQDALWEMVGQVVVNYYEQHSIFLLLI